MITFDRQHDPTDGDEEEVQEATARHAPLFSESPSGGSQPRAVPLSYPGYDLRSAIEVAAKILDRGNGAASTTELAQYLGYSGVRNGAFVSRLAAARRFELVEGPTTRITPTPRAKAILRPDYEETAQRASLEAFRGIPLFNAFLRDYEGKSLPDKTGMQNALVTKYGVPEKQALTVLERLLDSADAAGLFRVAGNRSKMIIPTIVGESQPRFDDPPPSRQDSQDPDRPPTRLQNGGRGNGGGDRSDPGGQGGQGLERTLLDKFPTFNPEWPSEVQEKWFDNFGRLMDMIRDNGSPVSG